MTVFEMQGILKGKAMPGDIRVNESLAEYLVRKLARGVEEFAAQQEDKLSEAASEGTIHLSSSREFAALQARVFAAKLREGRAKELNFDPSATDKMKLPQGKRCGDCAHIRRCKAIFGHVETNTYCDWSPSRVVFRESHDED
ncbi:hypothetical protein [Serratia fonticola]|uniref:hypothetical protein n=1 Tax=Serratia fonticola TaxID=47917 RepID=UPI003AAA72D1